MKKILFLIFFFQVFLLYSQQETELDILLNKCKKSYASLKDYTVYFSRKELVNGKYKEEKNILFKFMKPLSIYMQWFEGENEGMISVYVKGKHNDKLIVKPTGFFKFLRVAVKPDGPKALEKNRHPIYEADLGHFISLFEKEYTKAKMDKSAQISFESDQTLKGRTALVIKALFPENKGYYGHLVYIYIDKYYYLPIKVTVYDWNKSLLEDYQYDDIKINSALKESDFYTPEPDINY